MHRPSPTPYTLLQRSPSPTASVTVSVPDKVYIELSGAGTTALVAAPTAPGAFIRVFDRQLSAPTGVVKATWKSGSTTLFSDYPSATGGPVDVTTESGCIDCNPGEALNLTVDGACGGVIRYVVQGVG